MKRPFLIRISLILTLALTLAACSGQAVSTTWPGLAANDQLAYVASGQYVHAVHLTCDQFSKEAWKFPTAADNGLGTFSASPVVGPEVLVVAADGPTNAYSGVVFGLNPETGLKLWCLALDTKAFERTKTSYNCPQATSPNTKGFFGIPLSTDNRVMDKIALAGDMVYLGLNSGRIYAVEAKTGTEKWAFQAKQAVWAAPRVDTAANRVYVGSLDHILYALDAGTGAVIWEKDLGATIAAAPAQLDNTLYVGTFGNKVLALSAETGTEKWSAPTANWVWDSPVLYEGNLYFSDVGGNIYALNATTGERLWSAKPGDAARAAPAVSAEAIYLGDRTGKLYALNRNNGNLLWAQPQTLKGQLIGTPLIISNTLLLAPYQGDNLLVGYSPAGLQTLAFAPGK